MTLSPRDIALETRKAFVEFPSADLYQVDDDHNENDWRAEGTQAVNYQVRVEGRLFLITVEDITLNEED